MLTSTELQVTEAGAVVVQRAHGEAAASLRATAERLRAAAHPGVVEVVRTGGSDEEWEVVTVHGGRPLELAGPLAVERVAEVTAAVATTLADLHGAGIVHGRLAARRVLIGPTGRPVLHGFADPGTVVASPADDVAAVGALLAQLLDGAEPAPRSIAARRMRRALLHLADLARAEPATRRPPARRLATAIAGVLPPAAQREGHTPRHVAARSVRPRRAVMLGLATSLVLLGAAVVLATTGPRPESTTSAPAPSSSVPPSSTTTVAPPAPAPAPVRPASMAFGGRRYEVGQPGDVVRVGDWDCDGTPTPAVLRPATGEVFVFARWPDAGEVAESPVTQVPGATDLQLAGRGSGCDRLAVVRRDGGRVEIDGTGPR